MANQEQKIITMAIQEEKTMIEEREELMFPSNGEVTPKFKNAHFLKPTCNPKSALLPKHPLQPLPSKPIIKNFKKMVTFKGSTRPHKNWHLWVGNLRETHENTWKKAGIFDAIRASTYYVMRDNELIIGLVENWCVETNSFLFPWGECTITLEDVMVLGGFSVLGDCVHTPYQSKEIEEIENELVSAIPKNLKNVAGKIEQQKWMDYFMDFGGELEHIALIVLFLSRYVFSTKHYCLVSPSVFPIAICLAKGTRIALAPAVLASIYRDMRLLKQEMVKFVNMNIIWYRKLDLWAPFQLVQLWAWERFPTLSPKPISLFSGEPRLSRWQNLKAVKNKLCMMNCESLGVSFVWRPYGLSIKNWELPEFYGDEERLVLMSPGVGEGVLSFAQCLRPCELVGMDCIEQYLPQRVGLQFGLDQDIPSCTPRLNDSAELGWSTYDIPLDGVKLYLSPRLLKGDVTVRYFGWCRAAFGFETGSDSFFEEKRVLRGHTREERVEHSMTLDAYIMDFSEYPLTYLPETLFAVPIASCSAHCDDECFINTTTASCDKGNTTLATIHADNSDCLPSQSPENTNNKSIQNVNENVQDINKEALLCLSSSKTIDVGSALAGSIGEKYDERMLSSKKNAICDYDAEKVPFPSLENDLEKAVQGIDVLTLVDEAGKSRENSLNIYDNRIVDGVAANHIEASLISINPVDEVASFMNPPLAEMNEHGMVLEDTSCIKTDIYSNCFEGAQPVDEVLTADDDNYVSKLELDNKKLCQVNANDEQSNAEKFVSVKSGNATLGDKVVSTNDDNEGGTAISCDKRTLFQGNNHVDDSECLPSQSLELANNNSSQNVTGNVQDSNMAAPYLPSLDTIVVGSGSAERNGVRDTERKPSSENNGLNKICDVNNENISCPSLGTANKKDAEGLDSQTLLKVDHPRDEILTADDDYNVSKVEPAKKKLCQVKDGEDKASEFASVKIGNGALEDEIVVIDDGDDEEDEKVHSVPDPLGVLQFDARISKLERVVSKLQAKQKRR